MSRKKRPRALHHREQPANVDGQLAIRTEYYRQKLFRFIKGIFDLKCPDTWNKKFFLNVLCSEGMIFLAYTKDYGVLPFRGSVTGANYMNFPTSCLITTPYDGLSNIQGKFGTDSEMIYLDRDQFGRWFTFDEMCRIYAERLASADCGVDVNLMNAKVAYVAEADSKAQAETIKGIVNRATNGEPLVVYKSDVLQPSGLNVLFNHLKENYIANEILDTKDKIYNEFLSELGINNSNTDKRERLIVSEVDSNTEELENETNCWRDTLKECVDKIHKTFPDLDFDIKLRYGKKVNKDVLSKPDTIMGTTKS